tara:strand:- start:2998 stop:4860 length:1863 start_codon:yes stop_codon:yes gene_type:complete
VDWQARLASLQKSDAHSLVELRVLAPYQLDGTQTGHLDRALSRALLHPGCSAASADVRLAVLASSTTAHLGAGIRVAGLRRGLHVAVHEGTYGQFWQSILEPDAAIADFSPNAILLALDAEHLAAGLRVASTADQRQHLIQASLDRLRSAWQTLRQRHACQLVQQLPLPVFDNLMGNNEHSLPGSPVDYLSRLCMQIRDCAEQERVDLLSLDRQVARDGLAAWHDPRLWLHARMEISPTAVPLFGELLMRVIAARQGRSARCLVLDLDNTLWGGEVGEAGPQGVTLGPGSAAGEAYQSFQRYLLALHDRGVILAVCSKNDQHVAETMFHSHPSMFLKRHHIASFKANWQPKPDNLRDIASELNIGLDSMVFVDDSVFERELVRRSLPMVQTPEMPREPALYSRVLADAGYFESVALTDDDLTRGAAYQANRQRAELRDHHQDLTAYLHELDMRLGWQCFNPGDIDRLVQLINKTNQFNLTTQRYDRDQLEDVMNQPGVLGLQFRLEDRFGDNGIIAIVIASLQHDRSMHIDTFLLSCRVIGRRVEQAILNVLASGALERGATRLVGRYRPSDRNAIVRELYSELGFSPLPSPPAGELRFDLELGQFTPLPVPATVYEEGA